MISSLNKQYKLYLQPSVMLGSLQCKTNSENWHVKQETPKNTAIVYFNSVIFQGPKIQVGDGVD